MSICCFYLFFCFFFYIQDQRDISLQDEGVLCFLKIEKRIKRGHKQNQQRCSLLLLFPLRPKRHHCFSLRVDEPCHPNYARTKKQSVFNCYLKKIRVERETKHESEPEGGVDKHWTSEQRIIPLTCATTQCNHAD